MKPATGEEFANVPSVTATPTLKVIIEETRRLDRLNFSLSGNFCQKSKSPSGASTPMKILIGSAVGAGECKSQIRDPPKMCKLCKMCEPPNKGKSLKCAHLLLL